MKTIRIYAMTALVLMSVGFVKAQSTGIDFGIKGGVNYGTLPSSLKELSDKAGKMGFNIGVFARVGQDLYFQPEANFSTFGSEYTFSSQKYEPKFKQVNVPLMLGYKVVNTENMNFRVSLGPDLTYTLNNPISPADTEYKKFNAGGVINAGIDIGLFTIDARYSRDLTEINKGLDEKTAIFNLSVGFLIN